MPESLKRAIQATHRAHLQSQASQNEPCSSVSLPEYPTKRRKVSIDQGSGHAPNLPTTDTPNFPGHDENMKPPFSSLFTGGLESQVANAAPRHDLGPSIEATWDLQGTMRENYAHHDPMAMFPEPSSTVPNATLTQQRLLEGVSAPMMLGLGSQSPAPRRILPPEPSIPWSDDLKFTPTEVIAQEESSNEDRADHLEATSHVSLATPNIASNNSNTMPSSLEKGPTRSFESKVQTDTASASPGSSASKQSKAKKGKRKAKLPSISDHGSDDDLAIDNPKEEYKPRPSRSRSLRVDLDDTIDYSVRPEKVRKVSKRRKTADAASISNTFTTPEKIRQICEMGFTPSSTAKAVKEHGGDVTRAIEWLVTNGLGVDELATPTTSRRSAAEKQQQMPTIDSEAVQAIMRDLSTYRRDDPEVAEVAAVLPNVVSHVVKIAKESPENIPPSPIVTQDEVTSPEVQVVIPKRSLQTTVSLGTADTINKKAKRRKTTLDAPEPEPITNAKTMPLLTTEKKRARGRPRKTATSERFPEAPDEPTTHAEKPFEVLQSMDSNLASARVPDETATDPHQVLPTLTGTSSDEKPVSKPSLPSTNAVTAVQTPERSAKVAGSLTDKGKTPYRVGLSKRARIAPLLRVLKK